MAVCPTTAVTLCGEMSSNSGLCAGVPFCAVGCTFCSDKFDSTETVNQQEKTHNYYLGLTETKYHIGFSSRTRRGLAEKGKQKVLCGRDEVIPFDTTRVRTIQ